MKVIILAGCKGTRISEYTREFPKPMIKSPEFAAEQIYNGLIKSNSFEIHFPKLFTYVMKFLKF